MPNKTHLWRRRVGYVVLVAGGTLMLLTLILRSDRGARSARSGKQTVAAGKNRSLIYTAQLSDDEPAEPFPLTTGDPLDSMETAHSIRYPSKPKPNAELPRHVDAADGQLTLFADYDDVWENRVVLYYVNRTGKTVSVPAQDDDIYVKLETLGADGGWQRAQAHISATCGNSYHTLKIGGDEFIQVLGWLPQEGEEKEIRYRIYRKRGIVSNIVSNAGRGLVSPIEFTNAQRDHWSIRSGDIHLIKQILQEHQHPLNSTRLIAIEHLRSLPREQALPVLDGLLDDPDVAEQEWDFAISSLRRVAPDRLLSRADKALAEGGPDDDRSRYLSVYHELQRVDDGRLHAMLLEQARDPRTNNLPAILRKLDPSRTPEVKQLFVDIRESSAYSEAIRVAARFELERSFGDDILEMSLVPVGDFGEQKAPVPLLITIRNTSEGPVTVRYDKPNEIVSLYLIDYSRRSESGGQCEFFVPRDGVKWFEPSRRETPTVHVTLQPGDTHELRMNLLDYYDLPADYDPKKGWLSVFASLALPGVHEIPKLSETGAGISIGNPF